MIKKNIVYTLLIFILMGCSKLYVQDPEILGENPATLIHDKKPLENKHYGPIDLSISQREVVCNGVGSAKVNIKSLGSFYVNSTGRSSESKKKKGQKPRRDHREEKILIPVEKKIMVSAQYATCHVSIEFQPRPGAEYIYSTQGGRETTFYNSHIGSCFGSLKELVKNQEGKEEAVPVEVSLVPYNMTVRMFESRLFCDDKGNVLTWGQFKEFRLGKQKKKEAAPFE